MSNLKIFIDAFKELGSDVNYTILGESLLNSGRLSSEEIKQCFERALENGQIYERKPGWYCKA